MSDSGGPESPPQDGANIDRRTALKVIVASAALGGAEACGPATDGASDARSTHEELSGFAPLLPSNPLAAGTPTDPDLLNPTVPWPRVLSAEELRVVTALCDLIIPADPGSPSASQVGVPAYVDEYVSAPYPAQESDLVVVRGGLAWLNRQALERFESDFPSLTLERQREICDPIKYEPDAPDSLKPQARFFDLFRDITSTGFWTTEEGMADLGYMGNVPLPRFDGPPPEVLQALGLDESDVA